MAIVPALKKPIPVTTAAPMSATTAGVSPINTAPANGKFGIASVPTAEQRANPALQEWVTAKDKESATAQPVTPEQTQYSNNMDAWKTINWGTNGTANGMTGDQNLAAVINQPGNTVKNNPTPYISGVLAQAAKNDAATNTNAAPSMPKEIAPALNPMSAQQSYQPPDYAALAAARTAAALANKKTIAEQQKGSLDRSFQRSNQITQDNRTLENSQIDRTLNPFSGKTAYDKGIIGRERTLADESSTNNLNAQKANIDQMLSDYQNATADEQVRIADELQRADRAYNLDLAKFNQDQSNSDRTFNAGRQDTAFNQSMETAKYGLDVKSQHIDLANKLTELFGVKVNPTSDPMQSYAQVAGLSTVAAQKIAADAKQSTFDNAVKLALANNTITQTQASILNQARLADISQQNANTSMANSIDGASNNQQKQLMDIWKASGKAPAGIDNVTVGTPYTGTADAAEKAQTAESYSSYLDNISSYATDQKTGKKVLSNPTEVESAILLSNLSDYEKYKSYKARGLEWSGQIPTPGK